MIQGSAAPLLPPSPALAVATGGPPAHEDTGSAPRPEETTPRSPSSPTMRASSQLNRWSRARALRSGHRISPSVPVTNPPPLAEEGRIPAAPGEGSEEEDGGVCPAERDAALGKAIYMVSDGTGWTAEHSVTDMDRLIEIIKQAAKEGALVLYTLVDPSMAEAIKKACDFWGVPSTDVLRPTVEAIASHIGVAPSGIPRSSPSRQGRLTEDYFQRIDAVDFTIKQDDGAQPQNLNRAHIVLVGVSRTGKTPLSIYLAQKGYKVANVPIVMGVDLPKALFEINQDKIFALTINPAVLQAIRKTRAKTLGFDGHQSNYAEMEHVRKELEHANTIFSRNPAWPVIEITGKAIEETAAVVVRIYHDRKEKCSMPGISKRY